MRSKFTESEVQCQPFEALVTSQAEEVIALLAPWRQTQARINAELWQEIQDLKRMLAARVVMPAEKN